MADLIPFDGEMDSPVSGLTLKPFSGKMDGEDPGMIDAVKNGLGDMALKFNIGTTVDVPEQAVGINDILRKGSPLGIISQAITPEVVKKARDQAETAGRDALNTRRENLSEELSPEQKASDKKTYFTDDASWANLAKDGILHVPGNVVDLAREGKLFSEGWSDWRKVTGGAVESAPGTLLTMGPTAKIAGTAGKEAAAATLARTGSQELAEAAGRKAAERTAMVVGGFSEGVQGAGSANEQTRRKVMELPQDKLDTSPFYQEALKANGGDAAKARIAAADAAAMQSAGIAFLFDSTFGALGDRYLGTAAAGKGTRAGAVVRGIAQETPTEFIQSGGEKFGENLGVRNYADPSHSLTQDVGEEAVGGGLSGGLMGAGMGGVFHQSGASAPKNQPPQLPDTGPMSRAANVALATAPTVDTAAPAESVDSRPLSSAALSGPDRVQEIDAEQGKLARRLTELNTPDYGPAFDLEREHLAARQQDLAAERDGLTVGWPSLTKGAETSFSTEAGDRIGATYALADASQLRTSHTEDLRQAADYPRELQPRQRDRAASEMQISGMAQRLDPARLGESADAANGAPIIGADGLVESGNARTIALKRVYQGNPQKAEEYRQYLRDNALRFGLTPEAIDALPSPVLVRVRETPVDRAEFARQANAPTVAQMSPSEQARSDAARIDSLDDLRPDDNGDFITSRDFVRRFMGTLAQTERSALIDANGQLSQAGYARLRNAILAKAYGDSPVLSRLVESLDDNLRNVGKALMQAAPDVAKLRQDVADGALHDADITPDLLAAVEELSRLKDAGRSVSDALSQAGMFADGISPEARDLLRFLDDNLRRPRRIAEFIQRYTDALRAAGNPNQGSLLGDNEAPSKGQILTAARGEGENHGQGQAERAASNAEAGGENRAEPSSTPGDKDGLGRAEGEPSTSEWVVFPKETGTLGIPRRDMPQIKGEARGALINFLDARGIQHKTVDVAADSLKPTQAEFSIKKAENWKEVRDGVDRSVLASSDGYILDGHHQWVAALASGQPVKAIRFNAPINQLLAEVFQFPSVKRADGAVQDTGRLQARQDFRDALNDLGAIVRDYAQVARMVPEKTPNLMPTLVRLFSSGIKEVGYNIKDLIAYVKKALRAEPEFKSIWNKINDEIYRKAAKQAIDQALIAPVEAAQGDLFGAGSTAQPAAVGVSGDLFGAMVGVAPSVFKNDRADVAPASSAQSTRQGDDHGQNEQEGRRQEVLTPAGEAKATPAQTLTVDGVDYDLDAPNFGLPAAPITLKDGDPLLVETYKKPADSMVVFQGKTVTRAAMRQSIEDGYFREAIPAPESRKPIAYVMGGGGASGKGFIKNYLIKGGKINPDGAVSLDPDEVKPDIPEYDAIIAAGDSRAAAVTHEESSDIAKRIKARAIAGRYDLILDVTLGDPKKGEKYLQELKDSGYDVRLFGVTVQPELAVIRAMKRAQDTGRYVPINHLLAAHKGFNSAFESYAKVADQAVLFENTTERQEIAQAVDGKLVIENQKAYNGLAERSHINDQARSLREIGGHQQDDLAGTPGREGQDGERTAGTVRSLGNEVGTADGRREPGSVGGLDQGNQVQDSARRSDASPSQEGGLNEHADAGTRRPQGQESGSVPHAADQGDTQAVSDRPDGRDQRPGAGTAAVDRQSERVQAGIAEGSDAGGRDTEPGGRNGARKGVRRNAGIPAGRDIPVKTGRNYTFGDKDLTYEGSWLVKAKQNVEALELLKQLEKDGRQASRDEQAILAKFIGWGSSDIANSIFGDKLDKQIDLIDRYERAIAAFDRLGKSALQTRDPNYYDAFQVAQSKNADLPYYQTDGLTRQQVEAAKPDMGAKRWAELRDRIKQAMTPEEWKEASRSTQYAHYTSKPIVKAMWSAVERMGFTGGSILEPGAGIGIFPGLMSPAMATNSIYTGIEFDSITGGILKQLFPDERIVVESFIDSKLPRNFYDVAVGNPPFNNTAILADPEYKKLAFSLHDYFFAKTIDRVKPGGLVVFVTSRYTMDKLNDKARAYLAERADLLGAIRLPQTAFKKNAGTDVVTDVLFLRKKVDGETFAGAQAWATSAPMKVGSRQFPVNEYFHQHPEMVLGKPSDKGKMANSPDPQYTVEAVPGDIEEMFAKAAATLPENVFQVERGSTAEAAKVREIDFNPKAQKEGNYYLNDAGVVMQREGGVGVPAELPASKLAVVKDFIGLRDALKQAHYDQLNDGDWQKSLVDLQKAYQAFTDKHGRINQFTVTRRVEKVVDPDTGETFEDERSFKRYPLIDKIMDDPDYSLAMALESVNDETGEITESAFLKDRVLGKPEAPSIQTPADALLAVLNDVGHVDVNEIADRMDMSRQETIDALGSMVFEDPAAGWVMADEYLSGNVKKKLQAAQEAAKSDRRYERNIDALLQVQPSPVPPADITVSIGMNWIPGETYAQFLHEKTGIRAQVVYNERTGQWVVNASSGTSTLAATQEWGTPRRSADDILLAALSGAPIRITETVDVPGGGTKTNLLADATEAANQKLTQMREAFASWIWQDGERADKLVKIYNDTFNTIVPRKFDGSHLTLPGTSKKWSVFDHVKRGAWRIIQTGNTYLAHAVGSGKTFEMIISAMEQKRLGLAKKPMMVVPNHMLKQFAREWIDLYPAARLMVADEKNFHTESRRRFVSRVAMSDLDGVIITHSAFKLLDLDPEFKRTMIEQELDYLRAALVEAGGEVGGDKKKKSRDPKIKQIESRIEKMEQKLEAAMASIGKDQNVRFDQLGVDMLYVDEAHEFRKLAFATQRQVKGIDSSGSDRAFDLWLKTRWLEQKRPGRSLVMASGTPVTNTLAELYSVQRFMAPQVLEERGLDEFDAWASMFGQEHTEIEADASGKYAPVTRFSKFVNVPELTQMFREFADVLTSDHLAAMLGDKRPKVKDGTRKIIITPQTAAYQGFKRELADRLAVSRAWKPSKDEPNNPDPVIRIIGDGRLASIDMRFIDPSLAADPDSKLNRMIDEIIRVHKETADFEYMDKADNVEPAKGAAQIVFSDLGFGAGVAENRGFNARAWFEKRLRDAGVSPKEVAFMSDFKKSDAKLKLFKDINAGRVRIVVGSSKNMGTGVNAQQRLIALHHLDTPWYPADLEQREGRIIRQGNKNPLVQIYAYSTKGSYDAVMWQMLASKQRFIDQALSGDSTVRSIDDLSESSQFQIATAMTADDERAIQLAGVRAEIEKLQRLYRAHEEQRANMRREYDLAGETIRLNQQRLADARKAAERVKDLSGDNFVGQVDGQSFAVRKEWGAALLNRFKDYTDKLGEAKVTVGQISGFDVVAMGRTGMGHGYEAGLVLDLPEPAMLTESPTADPVGVALRATNLLANLARVPAQMEQRIAESSAKRNALEARLTAAFPMAEMLADKIKEADDIEAAMLADQNKVSGLEREQQLEDIWQSKTGAITPLFARGNGAGMALRDLKAVVDRVSRGMKNLPRVHVLESPASLSTKDPAQKNLRDFIRKAGAWEDVEGATHEGEIYLFASGLSDEARAEHVLAVHELTHYGLRGSAGKDLDAALQHIWMHNAKVRQQATIIKERFGLQSNIEAVEEIIAEMPSNELVKLTGWRRVVQAVRNWLSRLGADRLAARLDGWIKAGLDEQQQADLFVADLLNAAREWVRNGKGRPYMDGTMLATDKSLADDVRAQEQWLTSEAKARGYKSIDDMAEKNYKAFENLAKLWRERNPVDGAMLSRVAEEWKSAENPPEPGKPFMVYRLASPDENSLVNRNAADAEGLAAFIMSAEDYESSISSKGTTIHAYEVTVPEFGSFNAFRKGKADSGAASKVGMMAKWGGHWLSFPEGSEFKSRLVGSFSLEQARAKLQEMHGANYFDDVGSLKGAQTIRRIMVQDFNGASLPRLSRASLVANQATPNSVAERANEIINSKAASWKPVDTVMAKLTHAVRLDRLTTAIYTKAGALLDRYTPEQVKAGVVSDYGVPEAVLDHRTMMQGRMRVQLRKSGELLDKLATLTRAESRVAYEWMNNADPQAAKYFEDQLPPDSIKVMEEIKGLIDKLSQEAVDLGQLDPESFKRNRFEYLRRSYVKHTAELTKGETAARKRAIAILGEQYKGRGLSEAIDMAKFKNVAPEWWGRKLKNGQADKQLKGEKFIRLERRAAPGVGVLDLEQAQGPGETNRQNKGRLLEAVYWPAAESIPAKYSTWDQAGTWEVRDAKGGKLVVWRDFTKQERVAMGEIDEARYGIAKTLHGMIHDVETGRYLDWLATTYAKKPGDSIDGEIVEASERMRDTFKPGEWVQVPETRIPGTSVLKYGKLAGRYLPGPIWNDVRQTVGFRFKPLGETYAAILGAWKTAKTALSPAVHTNNVMANFVMADWHDVTAGHVLKALRIILASSERSGRGLIGRTGNAVARAGIADRQAAREVINRYQESGANLGSWVTAELEQQQLEPLLEALEKELGMIGQTASGQIGTMVALQKLLQLRFPEAWEAFKPSLPGRVVTTEAKSLIDLYEAEDQVFRLAAWLKAKEDGAHDLVAGKMARRSFLDYHINAPWIQAMRSTAFPFISFTYRSIPMLLEVAAKKPHKLMKLAMLAAAINALGYMMSGGDEDDERKLLPEEKAGSIWGMVPKLIRMPWNDANGAPVFLDIRRFIPVGDIFDTGATHSAAPMLPFAIPGGPLAVFAELVTNKSQFTGKDITLATDTAMEKAAKISDHLYKAFAPNIIILPGTYAWSGVVNASSGRTDSFGREQSTTQAVTSAFGVKLGSYPKDVLTLNAQRETQAKVMEIDRNITQLKREYQRKGIDENEFNSRLDAQMVKKVGVLDEFQKKMSGKK